MIAALFVETGGVYFGLPNVDPWDERRDARKYDGPWPVVAHPPCTTYCVMSNCRPYLKLQSDGGCFQAAYDAVRAWGGVLEQPAFSTAFRKHGIPDPLTGRGWQACLDGGWVCYIEQGRFGHLARKGTWLYAYGVRELPTQRPPARHTARGAWNRNGNRIRGKVARGTPIEFRDLLLSMADGARGSQSSNRLSAVGSGHVNYGPSKPVGLTDDERRRVYEAELARVRERKRLAREAQEILDISQEEKCAGK